MAYIEVEGITKKYVIGGSGASKNMRSLLSSGFGLFGTSHTNDFYALKDVSFSIDQGDVLGIVGKNGSGKSTLLKILSRVTHPTQGRITLRGKVASLLEVGTGFHEELTGRENIFLNGVILGMTKHEIERKFDEIVAFSGVERFLDMPVKRYSSGMLLRLAFSVSAHLDPEILIIDEVLGVGDVDFQKKCMQVMSNLGQQGRTILFVSHNLAAVRRMCTKAVLLNKGSLIEMGAVDSILDTYLMQDKITRSSMEWQTHEAPQDDLVTMHSIKAFDTSGQSKEIFDIDEPVHVSVEYEVKQPGRTVSVLLLFYNAAGTLLFMTLDTADPRWHEQPRQKGRYRGTCMIPKDFLNHGEVTVSFEVLEDGNREKLMQDNVISFIVQDTMRVQGARGDFVHEWEPTAVRPILKWQTEYQEND